MTPTRPALTEEGHLSPDQFVARCDAVGAALLAVLERERRALAGTQPSAASALFDEKASLADDLDRLESLRRERWPGDPSVLVDQLDDNGRTQWHRYVDTLSACREANAVNGRLVHARQRNVREALALLRGASGAQPATYDASGRPDDLDPMALGTA